MAGVGAPGRKATVQCSRPWKAPHRQHGGHSPLLKEVELMEGQGRG